ncbi:MAG: MopE-related protein [Myxococcota bacterium]
MDQVRSGLDARARAIHDVDGTFVSDLPALGMTGGFDDEGVVFSDTTDDTTAFALRLSGWGRGDALEEVAPVDPDLGECGTEEDPTGACIRRLEYDHGALTEWWLGLSDGVEQGWTLTRPPVGDGLVTFEVAVDGALGLSGDGPTVAITDGTGREWTVSNVIAWDARGDALPATVRVEGDSVVVEVDDTGAAYPITVDPAYTTAAWTIRGGTSNFGYSVAGAGDVDGDSYDDMIVGAYGIGASDGLAYVYYGTSSGISSTGATELEGESGAAAWFGYRVAGAGDVNGDGYDDLIVGGYKYSTSRGRAYLYLGGASGITDTADLTLTGAAASSNFGYSVASAGDVNADGYDDVVIGAYGSGYAYVYSGSASGLSTTANVTLTSPTASTNFGISAARAGDVNGDGYDDVIVGASGYSTSTGRAYVYHGSGSGLSSTVATTLTGAASSNYFGISVASAGDVDADGYDDVIVGAYGYSSYTGRAYVFHGTSAGVYSSAITTLTGASGSNFFGCSVAGLGDANADGFDDVAVGAYGYSTYTGQVTVYNGSGSGIITVAARTLTGGSTYDTFGHSIAAAGDVTGDGYADLLVGIPVYASPGVGRMTYYRGTSSSIASSGTSISAPSPYVSSPIVTGIGDVNADGYGDIAVGSSVYSSYTGITYIYLGSASGPSALADTTLTGGSTSYYFGKDVAPAGDTNGDGYDDVVVGAYAYSSSTGRVYLHRGSASGLSSTATSTLTGPSGSDYFGYALAPAGDTNGDGYDDVFIGAYGAGTGGTVTLYRGGTSGLGASATTTHTPGVAGYAFGKVVVSGDFDGDGRPDLAGGGPDYASYTGSVVLFRGSASGISTTIWGTLVGDTAGDYFGYDLGAGDIDADGYDDLVVGAYGYNSGKGRIYVYYGRSTGLPAVPATTIDGTTAAEYLGRNLAVAGDINGDGYDDVIAGEYSYSSSAGRALLFEGGGSGLSSTPISTFSGDGASFALGTSVAGAGDVNADGFDDLVIGGAYHTWLFYGYDTDSDADGSPDTVDCDDTDATIHPGATEVCDGDDNDCDGLTDEDAPTWYADADGDGYGGASGSTASCSAPSGYLATATDCDDGASSVHPGATETCNAVDDDCDSSIDETGATGGTPFYLDSDGDGYGTASASQSACSAPSGYVALSTDCDDTRAAVSPAATEACNSVDDDCDGTTDESGATGERTWYVDGDSDGFGVTSMTTLACNQPSGYVTDATDCNDASAAISPADVEICDGADNDCDSSTDEGVTSTFYADADGDGYGTSATSTNACSAPPSYVSNALDCDDGGATIHPGGTETCNSSDDDCDGATDEGVTTTYYLDVDGDGYGTTAGSTAACSVPSGYSAVTTDCDDARATIHPGAAETCNDVDDDCDSTADEGLPTSTFYGDADGDGYGSTASTTTDCGAPAGYAATSTDCNDGRTETHPGASEHCNGYDDDCDGTSDPTTSVDASTWYVDADGDTFGSAASTRVACTQPGGYEDDDNDCDDADATLGDGVTWYADADGDGYGSATNTAYSCDMPPGYVADATDCNDTFSPVNPGATETWYDGVDANCDGADDDDQDGDGHRAEGHGGDDCDDTHAEAYPGATEIWYDGIDGDCDGGGDHDADGDGQDAASGGGTDCDDADADVYTGAPDDPYDGVVTDCANADDYDADRDGHASADNGGDDCDDTRSDTYPGAAEVWYDGLDQDCAGDDDNDQDGDGVALAEDCDDTDPTVTECGSGDPDDTGDKDPDTDGSGEGCGGCDTGGGGEVWVLGLVAVGLVRRRKALSPLGSEAE